MCEICKKVIAGQAEFHGQFFDEDSITLVALPVKYCPCCGQYLERAKTVENERYAIVSTVKENKK